MSENKIDYRARSLARPPMHRSIPRADRVKVLELVLRRQFGAAWDLANDLEAGRLNGSQRHLQAVADQQAQYTDAKARLDGWLDAA